MTLHQPWTQPIRLRVWTDLHMTCRYHDGRPLLLSTVGPYPCRWWYGTGLCGDLEGRRNRHVSKSDLRLSLLSYCRTWGGVGVGFTRVTTGSVTRPREHPTPPPPPRSRPVVLALRHFLGRVPCPSNTTTPDSHFVPRV